MDKEFFTGNRVALVDELGGGLIVLTAFMKLQRAADSAAAFTQEANFQWLTGIEAPDWRLIIDGDQHKSWLVAPTVDASHQVFDGSLSFENAKRISGVDQVLDRKEGQELLRCLAGRHSSVHTLGAPPYAKYVDFSLNPAPQRLKSELKKLFAAVKDCRKDIARLRAIKQEAEIEAITKAAALSAEAFGLAKARLPSCKYEYEVEAELTYHFRLRGGAHAFEPIVASGKNACTLHYADNADKIRKGDLLLIDAGARVSGYPADITRTYAAGEVSKRQAAVHEAVRVAEEQIIALLKPGRSIHEYLEAADEIMKDALLSLGLIKNRSDNKAYRRYFPHAISHGLGLDVHESLGGYKELRPGMVLTVEPGIYLPEESIGVRIEDNIIITSSGHENITASLSTSL